MAGGAHVAQAEVRQKGVLLRRGRRRRRPLLRLVPGSPTLDGHSVLPDGRLGRPVRVDQSAVAMWLLSVVDVAGVLAGQAREGVRPLQAADDRSIRHRGRRRDVLAAVLLLGPGAVQVPEVAGQVVLSRAGASSRLPAAVGYRGGRPAVPTATATAAAAVIIAFALTKAVIFVRREMIEAHATQRRQSKVFHCVTALLLQIVDGDARYAAAATVAVPVPGLALATKPLSSIQLYKKAVARSR